MQKISNPLGQPHCDTILCNHPLLSGVNKDHFNCHTAPPVTVWDAKPNLSRIVRLAAMGGDNEHSGEMIVAS